jgi:hypothetical protein
LSEEDSPELKVLKELLKWTKFAGMNQVQSVLESTLNTPEKRLAYQLSDGKLASTKIAELSKVGSDFKVRGLWKEWRRRGLGDTVGVKGGDRFIRTFDLQDFGIEYPEIPSMSPAIQATPAPSSPQQNLTTSAVESP